MISKLSLQQQQLHTVTSNYELQLQETADTEAYMNLLMLISAIIYSI